MRGRRRQASHENHERWLVSYADFITLLFAFFVVMFASAQMDRAKAKEVSDAVERALSEGTLPAKVAAMLGEKAKDKPTTPKPQSKEKQAQQASAADLTASMEVLARELHQEIKDQKVKLRLEQRGLVVGLEEAAFFPSGEDEIKVASYPILEKLARVLNKLPNPLRLEGHTDSVPINTSRFHNNWELSAARSIAMLKLLNERFQVAADRMAIVGYGDTEASDSNDTPEGRARNRRVDVVIVSQFGMRAEPPQLGSSPGTKKN